jgi:hypothetical protein
MEGSFNKVLLITAANREQVDAKFPCPNVVPAMYSTASEVAVMDFGTLGAFPDGSCSFLFCWGVRLDFEIGSASRTPLLHRFSPLTSPDKGTLPMSLLAHPYT